MYSDLAVQLWRRGYRAIPQARDRADDASGFGVHLLGRRARVVRGPAAVRRFYDPEQIRRKRAVPWPLAGLLFGRGAVHGLDGSAHAIRKRQFLGLLDDDAAADLAARVRENLRDRLRHQRGRSAHVFDLLVEAYGSAVLEWAGIDEPDPATLSRRLAEIVDGFGGAGGAYPRAWAARIRADRWARGRIRQARRRPARDTPVSRIARWRTEEGRLLPVRVAGVELINVLRPAVAIAYHGTFAVLALADQPRWRKRLAEPASAAERRWFAHEVRRTSPFVPALAGLTVASWDGLKRRHRVILDVPGTNHDERTWPEPDRFDPERFGARDIDPFEFVPQGGGDPATGHRCPGEPATVEILDATVEVFASMPWEVLDRGHSVDRIPARERLVLRPARVEAEVRS